MNFILGISIGLIIGTALIIVALIKEDVVFTRILKEDKDKRDNFIP